VILLGALLLWTFAIPFVDAAPIPQPPPALLEGEALFTTHCARCHGPGARGTLQGPSFLDKIYEPNHHADAAFYRAPELGVRAHHWKFGDMPKIPGLSREDLSQIIVYIRWLQKEAGVF
jgi:mono/diheme cytochrome c family protein